MDPRKWLYEKLTTDDALAERVKPADVHGSSSLTAPPATKPFLMITLEPEFPGPFKGVFFQDATIWAHDEPGSLTEVDNICGEVRRIFTSQYSAGDFIAALYQGMSRDLPDDQLGTITRNVSLRLVIRR